MLFPYSRSPSLEQANFFSIHLCSITFCAIVLLSPKHPISITVVAWPVTPETQKRTDQKLCSDLYRFDEGTVWKLESTWTRRSRLLVPFRTCSQTCYWPRVNNTPGTRRLVISKSMLNPGRFIYGSSILFFMVAPEESSRVLKQARDRSRLNRGTTTGNFLPSNRTFCWELGSGWFVLPSDHRLLSNPVNRFTLAPGDQGRSTSSGMLASGVLRADYVLNDSLEKFVIYLK